MATEMITDAWIDIKNIMTNKGPKEPDKSLSLYAYIFMRRIMLVWKDCISKYLPDDPDEEISLRMLTGMEDYVFRDCACSIMKPLSTF